MPETDPLAHAAIEPITPEITVGLGTGRTATRVIRLLADRASAGRFNGVCVATSEASARLARQLGLTVAAMQTMTQVDYLFDGADEIDNELRMIKGGGGAMTREKIVAWAAAKRVYLVQRRKVVDRLGQSFRLPIEVLQFGLSFVRMQLEREGLEPIVRADESGVVLTDQSHCILDVKLPEGVDLVRLAAHVDGIPGVVGHGLFLNEADEVLIEDEESDQIERLTRR
ncbi:MAG: ribose-5-phosphate isomerase RpiA [Planctomycetota bacterium]